MTAKEYLKLEELSLKEDELKRNIMKIEDEMAHIDATIKDLNSDNVRTLALRYDWIDTGKPEWSAFNHPKLFAKALESYKQELGFLLADLKRELSEVIGLKEFILNKEED